jgi:hypothetical protein
MAVIRQLVAAGVAQHVGVSLDAETSHDSGPRSIMRENPGAVSGAPRSDTNTNGELLLSRWCCRSARSSRPVSALTLRTLRIAVLKSTCSPPKVHHFSGS